MEEEKNDLSGKSILKKVEEISKDGIKPSSGMTNNDVFPKSNSSNQLESLVNYSTNVASELKMKAFNKAFREFQKKSEKLNKTLVPSIWTPTPKLICTNRFLENEDQDEEQNKDDFLIHKSFALLSESVKNLTRDFFFCKNSTLQKFNNEFVLDNRMKSIRKIWISFYYGESFPLSYFNDLEYSDFEGMRKHLFVIYNQTIKIDTKENMRQGILEVAHNISRLKEMDKYTKSLDRFFKYLQREVTQHEIEDPRMTLFHDYLCEGFSLEEYIEDFRVIKGKKKFQGQWIKIVIPKKISKEFLIRIAKCKKLVEKLEHYKKYILEDEIYELLKEQNIKYMQMFIHTNLKNDPVAWVSDSISKYINKKYKIKWTMPEFKHAFQRTLAGISICQSEVSHQN